MKPDFHKARDICDSDTDFNLLDSLVRGSADSDAWNQFIQKYRRILFRWSVRWGAATDETDDVFQETLLQIHQCLTNYRKLPDTHFRSWLKTLAFRCWLQILNQRAKEGVFPDDRVFAAGLGFGSVEAREDLVNQFDLMAQQEILEFASRKVAECVEPKSWECFRMTFFDEIPGDVVAQRLGMSLNAVYLANGRIRRMLREHIERMNRQVENR